MKGAVININPCNTYDSTSSSSIFHRSNFFFTVHTHMTCTLQHTWTDISQTFQEYLMILMSAFSAAHLQETFTTQCSALAHSQASLECA